MKNRCIYDNFEPFYAATLSTALLSSYNSTPFEEDATRVIDFISGAYSLSAETTQIFKGSILGEMMNIGLITDYQAIASTELMSDKDKENIELYEIKGRVLEEVAVCEAQSCFLNDIRISSQIKNNMKYEYFHHPYNRKMRFWQIKRQSLCGNVGLTRQLGILYAVGVGCTADFDRAKTAFLKCIFWGDEVSTRLLAHLFALNRKNGSTYTELYGMMRGEDVTQSKEAEKLYNLIRLLNAFVIAPKKDGQINSVLAALLIGEDLSYQQKRELLINFNEKTWKNAVLVNDRNDTRIGFRVRENE